MILVDDPPPLTAERRELVNFFCEETGYGLSEILSFSLETKLFLTRNGGRYQVNGTTITHLAGPSPDPSERM